jgi:hypothetical protein
MSVQAQKGWVDNVMGTTPGDLALQTMIYRFSRPGDLVFDPFCATSSTGMACISSDRRFLGIEQDSACCNAGLERLAAFFAIKARFYLSLSLSLSLISTLTTATIITISRGTSADQSEDYNALWKESLIAKANLENANLFRVAKRTHDTMLERHIEINAFKSTADLGTIINAPPDFEDNLSYLTGEVLHFGTRVEPTPYLGEGQFGLFANQDLKAGWPVGLVYGPLVPTKLAQQKSKSSRFPLLLFFISCLI